MSVPNLNEICDCCGGYEKQPILQLFEDKCFRVVDGIDTHGEFCLKDFAYPVDGYTCTGLNVELSGGEITLFNNNLDSYSPNEILESGKLYARGVMVRIIYPTKDENGEDLTYVNKNVKIVLENSETFEPVEYPLFDLFTIFTNAKSNKTKDLINKIKIINPNLLYSIKVSALVLYGKAE